MAARKLVDTRVTPRSGAATRHIALVPTRQVSRTLADSSIDLDVAYERTTKRYPKTIKRLAE
jgi:hypothetical protein